MAHHTFFLDLLAITYIQSFDSLRLPGSIGKKSKIKKSSRQWVFSIPKRLRIYFLFDRKLLTKLSRGAWKVLNLYLTQTIAYDESSAPSADDYLIDADRTTLRLSTGYQIVTDL